MLPRPLGDYVLVKQVTDDWGNSDYLMVSCGTECDFPHVAGSLVYIHRDTKMISCGGSHFLVRQDFVGGYLTTEEIKRNRSGDAYEQVHE